MTVALILLFIGLVPWVLAMRDASEYRKKQLARQYADHRWPTIRGVEPTACRGCCDICRGFM